jgi:fatty acid amide hydrolase
MEAHLQRIAAHNPALNAVVWPLFDQARAAAVEADQKRGRGEPLGPLHGVPVTVKECLDLKDTPSTFGIAARASHRAESDDAVVARWKTAGAIVVGKTNVAQLLAFLEADNPVYGRSNNPWDLARTPGGSSGGDAASLSAGFAALSLCTDIGGSGRAPAAMCGLASFKPTEGKLPDLGRFSFPLGQRAIQSSLAVQGRTVADVALGLSAACGESFPLDSKVSGLKVGWFDDDGLFAVAPAVKRAVREAKERLEALGVEVVPFTPPRIEVAWDLFYGILGGDRAQGLARALEGGPRDVRVGQLLDVMSAGGLKKALIGLILRATGRHRVLPLLRLEGGGSTDAYWRRSERLLDYRASVEAAARAQGLNALLCPAFALPALKHGATAEVGLAGMYTALFNVLGWPAGVVPFTRVRAEEETVRVAGHDAMERSARETEVGSSGLPIGVQVASFPGGEATALSLMAALEAEQHQRDDFPRTPVTPR